MKKITAIILTAVMLFALCGCEDVEIGKPIEDSPAAPSQSVTPQAEYIQLNGSSAAYTGGGVSIKGATVTVTVPGEYTVKGELHGGQLVVDTGEIPGKVTLILDGVTMTNDTEPCILCEQGKTIIALADGSENHISSGDSEKLSPASDTASGAAIYGKDDLTITGNGSLVVVGAVNNGIASKNDLKINGGILNVTAANNGLKGNDSVSIDGGVITVYCLNDGIKTTNVDRADKGFVKINGGELDISASGDGVSASTGFEMTEGRVNVSSGEEGSLVSCKGVKAVTDIVLSGGSLSVSAYDHAVHCEGDLHISGGAQNIRSLTAKGISAHGNVYLSGGVITLLSASDGIEAKKNMDISGSILDIVSEGDGLNVGSAGNTFGFGSGEYGFTMSDGRVTIQSGEDGIDSNGDLSVNGGELIIDGPTTGGDDALDWASELGRSCLLNGGTVFAVHIPGMPQRISGSSAQGFIFAELGGFAPAGSTVTIKDASGNVIYTAQCEKKFGCVVFSSADVVNGETYTVTADSLSVTVVAGEGSDGQFGFGQPPQGQPGNGQQPPQGQPGNGQQPPQGQPPQGQPGEMPPAPRP